MQSSTKLVARKFLISSANQRYLDCILIQIQQDATLHSLFHLSSGAQTTVSTASGICHTVIVICRYRGRVGTGLNVLWVAYATHSTLKLGATGPDVGAARLLVAPGVGGLDVIHEPELKIRSGLRRP
jgi:hypothetical protein